VVKQSIENDWEKYPANCGSRRRDTHSKWATGVKVLPDHCDDGRICQALRDTTKKTLVQEELVVLVANAGEHHRYCEQKRERYDDNLELKKMLVRSILRSRGKEKEKY
jgi:hypothetical protein